MDVPQPPAPAPLDKTLDTAALLQHHRAHWQRVKCHHVAIIRERDVRYKQRLAVLLGVFKAPRKQVPARLPLASKPLSSTQQQQYHAPLYLP